MTRPRIVGKLRLVVVGVGDIAKRESQADCGRGIPLLTKSVKDGHPATNCNKSKYERYREAWHLLEDSKREKKIDRIQACAERFPASWFWAAAGRTEDLFGRLEAIAGKHQAW